MNEDRKRYEVIPSSPKALALVERITLDNQPEPMKESENAKYPFNSLQIGESFAVPFADMLPGTMASLRSSATAKGKQLSRKYRVLIHEDYTCAEVARIA